MSNICNTIYGQMNNFVAVYTATLPDDFQIYLLGYHANDYRELFEMAGYDVDELLDVGVGDATLEEVYEICKDNLHIFKELSDSDEDEIEDN